MKDGLLIGVIVGMIAGATLVSTNKKAKEIVEKGKKAVKDKIEKMS